MATVDTVIGYFAVGLFAVMIIATVIGGVFIAQAKRSRTTLARDQALRSGSALRIARYLRFTLNAASISMYVADKEIRDFVDHHLFRLSEISRSNSMEEITSALPVRVAIVQAEDLVQRGDLLEAIELLHSAVRGGMRFVTNVEWRGGEPAEARFSRPERQHYDAFLTMAKLVTENMHDPMNFDHASTAVDEAEKVLNAVDRIRRRFDI